MSEVKRGKGQPRSFESEEDFQKKAIEYLEYCKLEERLANVAGFCVFANINRDTFYQQKEYYSDTFNQIQHMLEDEAINCKHVGDSFKKFYMINKFRNDYVDRIEQNIDATVKVKSLEDILDEE